VSVDLGSRSYRVAIGRGSLAAAGAAIAQAAKPTRALIVSVPGVDRRYGAALMRSLKQAGIPTSRVCVPDRDRSKSVSRLAELWQACVRAGLDRRSVIVALGGGMVGDLAGFAAATFLRGISFVQVPTTLLAMVDASVGGKVAINLPEGKNLVGSFYQPRLVWIDTDTLRSLPRRERAAGMAEIVKAGAIWDAQLFAHLEEKIEAALDLEPEALLPAIEAAIRMKAEVVSLDERETGLRMLLNFGHTLAHAVEALAGFRGILHGEAVAMGMVYAARRSEQLGCAPAGSATRIEQLLARAGLPTELPPHPRRAYLEALSVDKKRMASVVQFIVLEAIGRASVRALPIGEVFPAPRKTRHVEVVG
jgi:3-dehydroquinate synthase